MNKKVSFILAAYNEENNIVECINSCFNQTYKNIEVCVTNDGSSDKTLEVLNSLEYENLKINSFENNKGKVSAFNSSYKMATGEYIAVIGADDVNLPKRIEEQVNHLLKNDVDLVWGGFEHIDGDGKPLPNYKTPLHQNPSKVDILQDNFIPGNTILFKKEIANKIFPIPEDLKFEDWWISFNTIMYYKYKILNKPVIKYRIHDNNTVGNSKIGYTKLRRKNIQRHIRYHEYFNKALSDKNQSFISLNELVKNYKLICLSDSFFKRMKLLIISATNFKLLYIKVIIKVVIVTVCGLDTIGYFRDKLFSKSLN